MIDRAGKNIGDRLDPTVRMPWKASDIIRGDVIPKVIEQQKWIEFFVSPKPNARRNRTPAPSSVGRDCTILFTGRIDMFSPSCVVTAGVSALRRNVLVRDS